MTTPNLLLRGLAALLLTIAAAAPSSAQTCDFWNPPPQTDTPDDSFTDSNGDGIDGMRCGPIFVAGNGNDRNPGTIDLPMRSLSAAILAAAAMTPVRDVYVSSKSVYYGSVWFLPGVNVYGGYDHTNGWSRSSARAIIYADTIGAWLAPGGPGLQTIDSLDIRADPSFTSGAHSIGLISDANRWVAFKNCAIRGGNATNGMSGTNGTAGATGSNGHSGADGECDSIMPNRGPFGGSGGAGATSGGSGGRAGSDGTDYPSGDGWSGQPGGGSGGGAGGERGRGGDPGSDGKNGKNGLNGAHGSHGAGGALWYANGKPGVNGTNGFGGGGGGGGGGQICTWCITGAGNSGGGGGGGGYYGTAGGPGTAGGSSIGVLVRGGFLGFNTDTIITAARAGNGGDGGRGGNGGAGGAGARGGKECPSEVGRGGDGGNGGNGGNGGHGGGGAGGNSIAVLLEDGLTPAGLSTWSGGQAGTRGDSGPGGNPGAAGISAAYKEKPVAQPSLPLPSSHRPIALHGRLEVPMDSPAVLATPLLADPDQPESYSFTVPTQPQNGFAAAAGKQILYKPKEGFSGYDAIPIRYEDPTHTPWIAINGYVVVHVLPPPLGMSDARDALRIGGGLRARASTDEILDVSGDGRIDLRDALEILRGL